MTQSRSSTASDIIAALAEPPRLAACNPLAARFVCSLRLIALHERAARDPVPELAARLGEVDLATRTLALAQTVASTWPENVHVSRFCCDFLTHDEATIGALIEAAWARDRKAFDQTLEGLIRPERIALLWDGALDLIAAEVLAS